MLPETNCDDCIDDDGDGRTDLADPSCGATRAVIKRAKIGKTGTLVVRGKAALPFLPLPGPVRVVVSDAAGHTLCATLPDAVRDGDRVISTASIGDGSLTVTLPATAPGKFEVKGVNLDLSGFTPRAALSVGLVAGPHRLAGTKGRRR